MRNDNDTLIKANTKLDDERADVIAVRKTCDSEGTGLSHYVLMDKIPGDDA